MKTGEYRWVRHLGNIEFVSSDDMTIKAFIIDIHDQYVREEEMRYSNTRYSLINAAMTEAPGIWRLTRF